VGIIVDAAEFALWLSPHILGNIRRILEDLFKWEMTQADAYAAVISEAAEHSGGGLLAEVPRTVHDCPDHEDNLVLDLAAEVGAMLIVSNETDLLSMSPWRGTPILTPRCVRCQGRCHATPRAAKAALRQQYDRDYVGHYRDRLSNGAPCEQVRPGAKRGTSEQRYQAMPGDARPAGSGQACLSAQPLSGGILPSPGWTAEPSRTCGSRCTACGTRPATAAGHPTPQDGRLAGLAVA
jgi:predicted nucleic acid-binding protein